MCGHVQNHPQLWSFHFLRTYFPPGIVLWQYEWQCAWKFIQASESTVFIGASLHRHDGLLLTWLNFRSTTNLWPNAPALNHVVVFSDMASPTLKLSGIVNPHPKSYCYYMTTLNIPRQIRITSKEMREKTRSPFGEGQIISCTEPYWMHHFKNLLLQRITYTYNLQLFISLWRIKSIKSSLSFFTITIINIITTIYTKQVVHAREQFTIANSIIPIS